MSNARPQPTWLNLAMFGLYCDLRNKVTPAVGWRKKAVQP